MYSCSENEQDFILKMRLDPISSQISQNSELCHTACRDNSNAKNANCIVL